MSPMQSINFGDLTTPRGGMRRARSILPGTSSGRRSQRSRGAFSPLKMMQEGGSVQSPLRGLTAPQSSGKFVMSPEDEARMMMMLEERFGSPLRDVVRGSQEFIFDPSMLLAAGATGPFAVAARLAPRIARSVPRVAKQIPRLKRWGTMAGAPSMGAGLMGMWGEAGTEDEMEGFR